MSPRTALLVSLPAAALLMAFMVSQSPDEPSAAKVAVAPLQQVTAREETAARPTGTGFRTGLEQLPASLSTIQVDGELQVTADGHLVPNRGLRRLFDFFLNAEGEEPQAVLVARIQAYLRHQLTPPAETEALAILEAYLALQAALAEQHAFIATPDDNGHYDIEALQQRKQALQSTQQAYLSPMVYAAFYQEDDDYDRYALERLAILQDTEQTAEQQQAALQALQHSLPDELASQVNADQPYRTLRYAMGQWQATSGSEAELRQLREQTVGSAAADRLEALDTTRADWQQRVDHWLAERAALLAEPQLAEVDRLALLDSQRDTRFTPEEQRRVQALERIHDRQR